MTRPATDARRPVTAGVLAGTAVWLAVVVACGLIGLIGTLDGRDLATALSELSQQASLATAAIYTGLLLYPFVTGRRCHEPRTPWWRGAIAVTLVVVAVVYGFLLDPDYGTVHSSFEHLVTPAVVVIDTVAVGRNLRNVSWWSVLTWLALPLAYLVYYNAADLDAYDIPLKIGDADFLGYFPGLLAGTAVVALAFVVIGKLRAWSGRQ